MCESNVDVRRAVYMSDTKWFGRVKNACSAMSLYLKDANLSARIEAVETNSKRHERRETMKEFTLM